MELVPVTAERWAALPWGLPSCHSPGVGGGVSWSDPHLSSLRLKRSLSFQSGSLFHFHPLFVEYMYLFNTFYNNPKARMLLASWRAHK